MKDYIENNIEIVKELIKIDNKIMKTNLNVETIIESSILNTNLNISNSLIYYDGNPITTIKIINSNINNCIIYPNQSFLAINRFIVSYKDNNHLCIEHNDFKYEKSKDIFERIIVLNDKHIFEQLKEIYFNVEYIEI